MEGLFTLPGILKIVEFVLALIAWACTVSNKYYAASSNLVYGVTVLIIFWCFNFFWILLLATQFYKRINLTSLQWTVLNFFYSGLACLLIFAGACCMAVSDAGVSVWQAGAAFAFFTSFAYLFSVVVALRDWLGRWFWEKPGAATPDVVQT